MATAINYFLKNYRNLTYFLKNPEILIENNVAERTLRSLVVGRKTWYGTHSLDGSKAAQIYFTILQNCKMSTVNPRDYLAAATEKLHFSKDKENKEKKKN